MNRLPKICPGPADLAHSRLSTETSWSPHLCPENNTGSSLPGLQGREVTGSEAELVVAFSVLTGLCRTVCLSLNNREITWYVILTRKIGEGWKRAPHSCGASACLGCAFPVFKQIMPEDIHRICCFPSWLSLQGFAATYAWAGTSSAGLGGGAKKKKNPNRLYTIQPATRDRCSRELPCCIHLCSGQGGTAVWAELVPGHAFLPGLLMPQVL